MSSKPETRTLHLDWDWKPPKRWVNVWIDAKLRMLEDLGYKVGDVIIGGSRAEKRRGYHVWVHVTKVGTFTEDEQNMLEWLLLDDPTRTRINRLRVHRGIKRWWSKLFSLVVWQKPIPRRCQRCRIRRYFHEMEEMMGKNG